MKIRRAAKPGGVDGARLLDEIQRAGELGLTTRELGARLGVEPARLARPLAKLNYEGLIRSSWVPNKSQNGGDPVQVAAWTVPPAPEAARLANDPPLERQGRGGGR